MSIQKAISNLKKEIKELERLKAINSKNTRLMTSLKKSGLKFGRITCRAKKYFSFVGEMKNGKRKREYIGVNKKKKERVEKKIINANKYREAESENKAINAWVMNKYFKTW